ncbi:MAG: hypothetical protein JWP69_608 [Flaviaesturariibacter sp.]|nr:hypothetical protein [Flaviaesturariibacter sp.]
MQKQVSDIDRLSDIETFSNLIIEKVNGLTEEDFYKNETIQWAFIKWLENIGEAAYQLSEETILEFDQIDWRSIINARHFYVHHYHEIQWSTVWKTITTVDFVRIRLRVKEIKEILKARYSV